MVEEQIVGRGIKDPKVIGAMKKVPRYLFVEEALQNQAYSDHPYANWRKANHFPILCGRSDNRSFAVDEQGKTFRNRLRIGLSGGHSG